MIKLILVGFFVTFGILYLNYPEKVFKINAFFRENFFNDACVSLHRKTVGLVFLLIGLILLAFMVGSGLD